MSPRGGPSLATLIERAIRTTESRNSSGTCAPRPDVLLFLQLPLQLAHEGRQTRAAFALQPLGLENRLHLGKRFVDIVIDHDVIVFRPMAHFMAGTAHSFADDVVGILCRGVQAFFEVGGYRRADEYACDRV